MSHTLLRYSMICLGWMGRCLLVGILFFCLILLALRYWILPDIGQYRADIATAVTRVAGQTVQIDAIQANWDGLRPHLSMRGVSVYDRRGNLVLVFPTIEGTVSWRSAVQGELNFHKITIDQPAVLVRRDKEGLLHIAGVTLSGDQQESGFFDWLLRQRRLMIRQAVIYWQDDLRRSTVHYFESVNLHLQNKRGGKRHQFGLRAESSGALFSKVDIRGDLKGESIQALSTWQGRLFVQLQDFNLENWQEWMPLPTNLTFKDGQGSIRTWMDINAGKLTRWTTDINLRKTVARFARELPPLAVNHLYGRSGWSKIEDLQKEEAQWFVRDFNIELKDLPPAGPIAASWRELNYKDGKHLPKYQLQTKKIDLNILSRLATSLPFSDTLHQSLSDLSPRGAVKHANIEWQGYWSEQPPYRANVAFNNLAIQPFDKYPALSGISGMISATKTGGSLVLSSQNVVISKKRSSNEKIRLDTLIGRVDWQNNRDRKKIRSTLNNINFAGEIGKGTFEGSYVVNDDLSESIDLTGHLSQADLSLLRQNITWLADENIMNTVSKTAVSGQLHDAKFRIKGTLGNQSTNSKERLFIHADTDIHNASIKIADDWPTISEMTGHVSVQDGVLNMSLTSAGVAGIKLREFTLQSADLYAKQPEIKVKGVAEGETSEVATLLYKADINQHVSDLLSQIKFFGKGRLQADAALSIAQETIAINKMRGRYQFVNNRINLDRYIPDLEQVNGLFIFTETNVALEGIRAQVLGGSAEIASVITPEGAMRITASGRADFDHFRSDGNNTTEPLNLSSLWTQFMQGGADWRINADIGHDYIGVVLESSLKDTKFTLPAPLTKAAGEMIPVRVERYFTWPHDDHIRLRYGDIVTAEFQRVHEKTHYYRPLRGVIHFGGTGILPRDQITQIKGSVTKIEWDQWRELFRRHAEIDASVDHTVRGLDNILTKPIQFDLKIGQLEFLASYFNDVHLAINKQDDIWQMQVTSREITGKIDWHATIPQRLIAHLSKLIMPEDAPKSILLSHHTDTPGDWPTTNIEADELIVDDVLLGQLKLNATQKQEGWQVENLNIKHPDSTLQASGLWENHISPFRVFSHIRLQSNNIEKFLKRQGYPDRVARGEGEVSGDLQWVGKPFSIDFPSLSGDLQLDIRQGQFTGLKPGIGRLLGIFDLKSLPRRLTLDFYDVFGKGFGFDQLDGHLVIQKGIASTNDLYIAGSSAELVLSGEWDLINETQALNLKVFPSFGLATPIAGIAAMIASGTLQDPFGRVLLNEYTITGSWDDPVVVKLSEHDKQTEQPKTGQP